MESLQVFIIVGIICMALVGAKLCYECFRFLAGIRIEYTPI